MVKTIRHIAVVACMAVIATACAGPSTAYRTQINQKIARGDLGGALAQVEASKNKQYSKKNAVLYYLDKGALLYDLRQYKESDIALAEADRLMEELFTRSITRGIGTVLLNDNTTEYGGEIFERAIMHTYRAMNYVQQNNRDEALVEARRVTSFLSRYNQYMQGRSGYKDSPFAQYLSAMLYEEAGEVDDARIAYDAFKKASSGNFSYLDSRTPRPGISPSNSGRKGQITGRRGEKPSSRRRRNAALNNSFDDLMGEDSDSDGNTVEETRTTAANLPASSDNLFGTPEYRDLARSGVGEIVLIHYNGPAPMKISRTFQVAWDTARAYVAQSGESNAKYENAIRSGFTRHSITVAYPEYTQQPYMIETSQMSTDDGNSVRSLLMEDIAKEARETLAAKKDAIWARAVARATIKFVIAEAAAEAARKAAEEAAKKNNDNPLFSLMGSLAGAALRTGAAVTEVADTRGWTTVPAQIRIARMTAKPGLQNIKIDFMNAAGMIIGSQIFEDVNVVAGKRTYLHVRTAM